MLILCRKNQILTAQSPSGFVHADALTHFCNLFAFVFVCVILIFGLILMLSPAPLGHQKSIHQDDCQGVCCCCFYFCCCCFCCFCFCCCCFCFCFCCCCFCCCWGYCWVGPQCRSDYEENATARGTPVGFVSLLTPTSHRTCWIIYMHTRSNNSARPVQVQQSEIQFPCVTLSCNRHFITCHTYFGRLLARINPVGSRKKPTLFEPLFWWCLLFEQMYDNTVPYHYQRMI